MANPAPDEDPIAQFKAGQEQMAGLKTMLEHPKLDSGGASYRMRLAVSSVDNERDKIKALESQGATKVTPFGDGNFVFVDPDTKRPTVYNPGVLKAPLHAAASLIPEIGEGAGGVLGALLGGAGGAAAGSGVPIVGTAAGAVAGGMAGAGVGGATGRETTQTAMRKILGVPDSRGVGEIASDFGVNAALNAAGEGVGRAVAAGGRALLPRAKALLPGEAAREAAAATADQVAPTTVAQATSNAAERQGIPITAGTTTGQPWLQSTEAAVGGGALPLGRTPGGTFDAGIEAASRRSDEISTALNGGTPVPRSPEALGDNLRETAQHGLQLFENNRAAADAEVRRLVPDASPVRLTNVANAAATLAADVGRNPALREQTLAALRYARSLLQNRPGQTMDFAALRDFRTNMGADLFPVAPIGGVAPQPSQAEMRVYRAIRNDLQAHADNVGTDAGEALRTHDRMVTAARNDEDLSIIPIQDLKRFITDAPDALATQIVNGDTKAGRLVQRLQASVAPEEFQGVAAQVFKRMGEPTAGATGEAQRFGFSFNNFASRWKDMSVETKDALFGATGPQRQAMNDLARVAEAVQSNSKQVNWSHSGDVSNKMGLIQKLIAPVGMMASAGQGVHGAGGGTVAMATAGAGGALLGPAAIYNLLQVPGFTRWLSGSVRDAAASSSAGRPAAALARLAATHFEPKAQELVNQYLQSTGYQPGVAQ